MSLLAPLPPGLFMALLLGSLYGSICHLLFGRQLIRLPFGIAIAVAGCALVWLSGVRLLTQLPAPGGLPLAEASIVAWVLLVLFTAWRRA